MPATPTAYPLHTAFRMRPAQGGGVEWGVWEGDGGGRAAAVHHERTTWEAARACDAARDRLDKAEASVGGASGKAMTSRQAA